MAVDLKILLPEWFKNIEEFNQLLETEGAELDKAEQSIRIVRDNCYIQTANVQGIERWEALLGIKVYPGDGIEERRAAVLAKWNQNLPYTRVRLKERLNAIVGKGSYELFEHFQNYELEIIIFNQTYRILQDIRNMAREMIPANLVLSILGKYPFQTVVPVTYDNCLGIRGGFYPRYNLDYHHLSGCHYLDGSKYLNGYSTDDLVDFYPLEVNIKGETKVKIEPSVLLHNTGEVNCDAKSEAVIHIDADAVEELSGSGSAGILSDVIAKPTYGSGLTVEKNLRYLDGSGYLDGTNLLNADITTYTI